MFISDYESFYDEDDQDVRSGKFLVLVLSDLGHAPTPLPIRALVRQVTLRPLGNFMMGIIVCEGHKISLSGAYGNNGLPVNVPDVVYQEATPLPIELIEAWNNGGGWNDVGTEAPAMREWAMNTFLQKETA